jgi:hypothetical protein
MKMDRCLHEIPLWPFKEIPKRGLRYRKWKKALLGVIIYSEWEHTDLVA